MAFASLIYTDANLIVKGEKAVAKKVQYANLRVLVGYHPLPPVDSVTDAVIAPYASQFRLNF